jgi:hypothetical protein
MDYVILIDDLPSKLEKQVISYLEKGWEATGGVTVIKDKSCKYGEKWLQAMIKKEGRQ